MQSYPWQFCLLTLTRIAIAMLLILGIRPCIHAESTEREVQVPIFGPTFVFPHTPIHLLVYAHQRGILAVGVLIEDDVDATPRRHADHA